MIMTMTKLKVSRVVLASGLIALSVSCGKKKEDDAPPATSENVKNPVGALAIVKTSMQSSGSGISSAAAALALDSALSETDCDDNAEPKARTGEPADNSGRLQSTHARYALQDLYCKVQKDTGAPDSFPGALTSSRMIVCMMGGLIQFDGVERTVTIPHATVKSCLSHLSAAQQAEMLEEIGTDDISGKITAGTGALNPVNTTGKWDAGIKFTPTIMGQEMPLQVLVADNADVMAIGVNSSSGGATIPVDSYVASIDKKNSAIRYEAMFQRIRTANGSSNNGWNRHIRAYVKGTMDANYIFSSVDVVQGIYSDISVNAGSTNSSSSTAPLQSGLMWTVRGEGDGDIVSRRYALTTPTAPNSFASWGTAISACNGSSTDTTCTTTPFVLASNDDTAFAMDLNNSSFTKAEEWFKVATPLTFTTLTFAATP
jgi:hypothetical protein